MVTVREYDGLPVVTVDFAHRGAKLTLNNVVVDTGAAISVFKTDDMEQIGIVPEPFDVLDSRRGVGGSERVIEKTVDEISVGELTLGDFDFDMSSMHYADDIDGLLGYDFLKAVEAVVDFGRMQILGGVDGST